MMKNKVTFENQIPILQKNIIKNKVTFENQIPHLQKNIIKNKVTSENQIPNSLSCLGGGRASLEGGEEMGGRGADRQRGVGVISAGEGGDRHREGGGGEIGSAGGGDGEREEERHGDGDWSPEFFRSSSSLYEIFGFFLLFIKYFCIRWVIMKNFLFCFWS